MAIEKSWSAVPPRLFTVDGGVIGLVTVTDASGFKVKQKVVVQSTAKAPFEVQVKRVLSPTTLLVGPIGGPLTGPKSQIDLSSYTVAEGAFIFAGEQPKSILSANDVLQAIYEQEPTLGLRSILVDQFGDYFDSITGPDGKNRLAVDADVTVNSVQIFTRPFDAITVDYPSATQEIYFSRVGGLSGAIQETVTLNYTDATKNNLMNVVRT